MNGIGLGFGRGARRGGGRLSQRDAAILGDHVCNFGSDLKSGGAILILAQQRKHFASKAADFARPRTPHLDAT